MKRECQTVLYSAPLCVSCFSPLESPPVGPFPTFLVSHLTLFPARSRQHLSPPHQLMVDLILGQWHVVEPAGEVRVLSTEPGVVVQAVDPTQQLLEVPQGHPGLIPGDLVTGEFDGTKDQSSVFGPFSQGPVAGLSHHTLRVVRDDHVVLEGFREPLGAVPGEVLEGHQRAVHHQHHVESPVTDDDVVGTFDHLPQGSTVVGRRGGPVDPAGEDLGPW